MLTKLVMGFLYSQPYLKVSKHSVYIRLHLVLQVNNSLESETITSVFDIIIPINFMHHHRISNSKQIQSMIAILIPRIYFSITGCCSTFNFSAASKYIDRHLVAMCTVRLFVLLISKGQCARLASKRRFH